MGLLQNGQWVDQWYDTKDSGGEFRRQASRFRSWLTADGEAGPNGEPGALGSGSCFALPPASMQSSASRSSSPWRSRQRPTR